MAWLVEFEKDVKLNYGETIEWIRQPSIPPTDPPEEQTCTYIIRDMNGEVIERGIVTVTVKALPDDGP